MTPKVDRNGWLLYDQDCGICRATAAWLATRVSPKRLGLMSIAEAEADPRIGAVVRGRPLAATIHFVRSDDLVLTGARAVLAAGRLVPRWRLVAIALDHNLCHSLSEPLYRLVAANRRRIGRALGLPVACPLPARRDDSA
jgi:predicted DCC family thiol-disulfide oxidoreductase YuxK